MLVLTRKNGEKIRVGSDIVLTVIEVRGNNVRLGIDAPKNIPIARDDARSRPVGQPPAAGDAATAEQPTPQAT